MGDLGNCWESVEGGLKGHTSLYPFQGEYPRAKTLFLAHFVAESGLFGRFGGV